VATGFDDPREGDHAHAPLDDLGGYAPLFAPSRPRWTQAAVVDELRRLHATGVCVRDRDLRDAGHGALLQAAQLVCGGLGRARRLAGIALARRIVAGRQAWDAGRVVAEIHAVRASGAPLVASRIDPRLYLAARRYFATWPEALAAR
jgi:hypothetical protein